MTSKLEDESMHILIVALHRPTKPTGVCRHAANLARCLAEAPSISRITFVTGAWQANYFQDTFLLKSEKVKIVSIDIKNNSLSRNFWFLLGLPKIVSEEKPDIVHCAFPFPFLKSQINPPVVSTVHDLYPYEFPQNFGYPKVLFNQYFLKSCVFKSDGLTCVSQTTLESLKNHFKTLPFHQKQRVIYNFVDFSHIIPQLPHSLNEIENIQFILTVAQHQKNKNIDLLIRCFSKLVDTNHTHFKQFCLIIVGNSGSETELLYNLIHKLNLEGKVLFLSCISDSELLWLYQNCELFIIPSSTEGFCVPLAEAIYTGCKIVCSDIPIFREIGSDQCVYFSLQDNPVENLFTAFSQALQKTETQNAQNGQFKKSNTSQQYIKLYSDLLKSMENSFI
jgi:glycosyltransferase involved in cell wall biosynthesis